MPAAARTSPPSRSSFQGAWTLLKGAGFDARDQVRFFYVACLLGADPTRWDICGWLRMPGGLRVVEGVPTVRQRVLFCNPEAVHV